MSFTSTRTRSWPWPDSEPLVLRRRLNPTIAAVGRRVRARRYGRYQKARRVPFYNNMSSRALTRIKRGNAFDDSLMTTLIYSDTALLSSTGAPHIDSAIYRGNGMYDPTFAIGGHQPSGFDEYSVIYSKYLVVGSSIRVIYSNEGSTAAECVVYPANTGSVPSSFNTIQEKPYIRHTVISPKSEDQASQTMYASTKKMLGLTNVQPEDNVYTALTTADPSAQWFWHVSGHTLDDSSVLSIRVRITIKYKVIFFARNQLSGS